jgi:hypothetical protein
MITRENPTLCEAVRPPPRRAGVVQNRVLSMADLLRYFAPTPEGVAGGPMVGGLKGALGATRCPGKPFRTAGMGLDKTMPMIKGVGAFGSFFGIRAIDADSDTFEIYKNKIRAKSTYKCTDIDKTQNYSVDRSSRSPEHEQMSAFWRDVTSLFALAGRFSDPYSRVSVTVTVSNPYLEIRSLPT